MNKVSESAMRNVDLEDLIHQNEETSWEEFQEHHPEIYVLYNELKTKVVDIDFSRKVESPLVHQVNGEVESVRFYFNGYFYCYPPEYKYY